MIDISALQDAQPVVFVVGGSLTAATAAVAGFAVQIRARRRAERSTAKAQREAEAMGEALAAAQRECAAQRARADQASAAADRADAHAAEQGQWLAALAAELEYAAKVRLPTVVDIAARGHHDAVVPGLLEPRFEGTETAALLDAMAALVREAAQVVGERIGDAARTGVGAVAADAQAYLIRLQNHIDEELNRHLDNAPYQQSLVRIDQQAALAVHRLQRLRILAGSWPGLQRDNCPLSTVIEGARGRVADFERVRYTYEPESGEQHIEGRVVEPVALVLAELMANATACSTGPVLVYIQRVQNGWCVLVDDGGVNMNAAQRAKARAVLEGSALLDVTTVPDARSLGYAVVGRLAHTYGFRVSIDAPSDMGGVKATVFIPNALTADGPTAAAGPAPRARRTESAPEPAPPAAAGAGPGPSAEAAPVTTTTAAGLPKRQPSRTAPAAAAGGWRAVTDDANPDEVAAGFAQRAAIFKQFEQSTTDTPSGDEHV